MTWPDLAAAIVDSSGDAIIGQTLDGAIVSWNRGAKQLCGYAAEVTGRNIRTLAPRDDADELAEVVSRVAALAPWALSPRRRPCSGSIPGYAERTAGWSTSR